MSLRVSWVYYLIIRDSRERDLRLFMHIIVHISLTRTIPAPRPLELRSLISG